MRIAVIGAGISGLAAAWLLSREHEVVLYEANDYLGGHTHTHDIRIKEESYPVDSGFIVFSPDNYPLFTKMLDELGVATRPTTMSFAVRNDASGLEYNASNLNTLFCQRSNLFSARFIGMVRDLLRFYREAPRLLAQKTDEQTLGNYLAEKNYSMGFREDHLLPMASALWSSPTEQILEFPVRYLVQFMANHHMLQIAGRPQWKVIQGGSQSYVRAMCAGWCVQVRLKTPVNSVQRLENGVRIADREGTALYDQVVFACHSDQALALLSDATTRERDILGAIEYQNNDVVLHTDTSLLPRNRKAWGAWNVLVRSASEQRCSVTYCMNLLQSLSAPVTFCVSLNQTADIDDKQILRRMHYRHPVYNHRMVAAQKRRREIQGQNRTWFGGAYWGWGFHEDGMRSAVEVASGLGVPWP